VVRAEHPLPVGQQLPEQAQRPRRVAAAAGPGRDVVPGGEGVGVVRAEHLAARRAARGGSFRGRAGAAPGRAQPRVAVKVPPLARLILPSAHRSGTVTDLW